MRKYSVICILLVLALIGLPGCAKSNNSNNQINTNNSIPQNNDKQNPIQQTSKYAKSPEEVVRNYLNAASKQDEKAALACSGIIWNDKLAGFWDNEYAGASMTATNIIYKENPDPNFDANSAIKDWFANAAKSGLNLDYTYNEIISYGVVYCNITVAYNGETGTLEGATFDVVETKKGWFMVSIDTAR